MGEDFNPTTLSLLDHFNARIYFFYCSFHIFKCTIFFYCTLQIKWYSIRHSCTRNNAHLYYSNAQSINFKAQSIFFKYTIKLLPKPKNEPLTLDALTTPLSTRTPAFDPEEGPQTRCCRGRQHSDRCTGTARLHSAHRTTTPTFNPCLGGGRHYQSSRANKGCETALERLVEYRKRSGVCKLRLTRRTV